MMTIDGNSLLAIASNCACWYLQLDWVPERSPFVRVRKEYIDDLPRRLSSAILRIDDELLERGVERTQIFTSAVMKARRELNG